MSFGLTTLDEDISTRFKIFIIMGVSMFIISEKLKSSDSFKLGYMLIPYPVILVLFTEIIITSFGYSRMTLFGALNQIMHLLLKFSNVSKYEKVAIKTFSALYIVLRLVLYAYLSEVQTIEMKEILPLVMMNILNYMIFDLDDEINRLLNTRFNKTQQMWLESLESMPTGVMIYNREKQSVIFENKRLDDLFEGHDLKDKFACTLKSTTENEDNEKQREFKSLMQVLQDLIQ